VYYVNCGKAYEPSYKFCNYCGHPVPLVGGLKEDVGGPDQPAVAAATPQMAAEAAALFPVEPPSITSYADADF